MAKSLAKNSVYTLVANLALAASNWLVLVLIAKSYAAEQLGLFVVALSLFSPAFLLASFKVRTLLIVDHAWRFKPEHYAFARIFANLVAIAIIIIIAERFFPSLSIALLSIVAIYKMADAWSEFCQSYLRRHQCFEIISMSTGVRAIFTIVSLLIAIWNKAAFIDIMLIWMASALVFCIVDTWLFYRFWDEPELNGFKVSRIFGKQAMFNAFKIYYQHFTVAVALLIGALFVYMPNYTLAHYFSTAEAGVFATISYFLVAGGILINSLSQAATPQLVDSFKVGDRKQFGYLVGVLCGVGLFLGCAGIAIALLLGEWILTLFYTPEIGSHAIILVWVMIAAGIRYMYIFLGTALASLKQFSAQTWIAALGFFVLSVSLFAWVPEMKMEGAAKAMAAAALAECLAYLLVFRHQVSKAFSSALKG